MMSLKRLVLQKDHNDGVAGSLAQGRSRVNPTRATHAEDRGAHPGQLPMSRFRVPRERHGMAVYAPSKSQQGGAVEGLFNISAISRRKLTQTQAILAKDRNARILTAGDFNEFTSVEPLKQYTRISGLIDADAAAGIPENERYTYLFDMNTQQLDHMFVSPMVARKIKYEHIHINTWVDADSQISDHDPSVALANLCSN